MLKHATRFKQQLCLLNSRLLVLWCYLVRSSLEIRIWSQLSQLLRYVAMLRVIFDSRGEMLEAKSAAYHKAYERLSRADCEIFWGEGLGTEQVGPQNLFWDWSEWFDWSKEDWCSPVSIGDNNYFLDVFISDHRKGIAASKQCVLWALWALACRQSILVHSSNVILVWHVN